MDTITIKLTNRKALKLLEDMEDLNLIRMLKKTSKNAANPRVSAKFRGALHLTEEEYLDFQNYAKDIRNEWNRNI